MCHTARWLSSGTGEAWLRVHVKKVMSWDDDFLGARASRPQQTCAAAVISRTWINRERRHGFPSAELMRLPPAGGLPELSR